MIQVINIKALFFNFSFYFLTMQKGSFSIGFHGTTYNSLDNNQEERSFISRHNIQWLQWQQRGAPHWPMCFPEEHIKDGQLLHHVDFFHFPHNFFIKKILKWKELWHKFRNQNLKLQFSLKLFHLYRCIYFLICFCQWPSLQPSIGEQLYFWNFDSFSF